MRKIIIFAVIFIIIILCVVVYFYIDFLNSSKTQSSLSTRAREFLAEQKNQDNSLSDLRLSGGKVINQDVVVDKCFTFHVPFKVSNINTDNNGNPCYRYVAFNDPKGSIVIYKQSAGGLPLENAPGVSLRRLKKEIYKEESAKLGSNSFLIFKDTSKPYEKTAYMLAYDNYIIITLSVTDPEVSEEKFTALLSSVQAH